MSEAQVKQWVRDELKRILDAGLMYTEGRQPTQEAPPATIPALPKELADLLNITPSKITPKAYIHNADKWNEINNILKEAGYKWVSAGRESHWGKP